MPRLVAMMTFTEPVLTAPEELRLARAIEAGVLAGRELERTGGPRHEEDVLLALQRQGEQAHSRFVAANLRLVALVANPVAARAALDRDDLFQEGVLGLLEAVRRFDPARGARFATFALPWIRMRVGEAALTRCGALGIPPGRARLWIRALTARDALAVTLGRTPTEAEVAEASDLSVTVVRALLAYTPPRRLGEVDVVHPSADAPTLDPLAARRLLRLLPVDERRVLVRRYGLTCRGQMSFAETAVDLGISTATVRRRERSALARLRGCDEALDAVCA